MTAVADPRTDVAAPDDVAENPAHVEPPASSPADESSTSSAVEGAGWLGAGAVVVKMSQTAVLLLLAALLAPDAIGVLSIGALVLNITSAFTDLGTSTALVYWRGDAQRAARSALTLALALSGVVTAAMWALAPALSAALNTGDLGVQVVRGMMLCLPLMAVAGVGKELLRRALAFRRRVLPDMVGALVGAGLTVVLAVGGSGAMALVYGQVLQAALTMVLLWLLHPPVRPGWDAAHVRALLAYGASLAGGSILTLLMLNVDYLVIAHQLGAQEVGVYSMAFRLAYMPYLLVAVVIGGALFAHLCRTPADAVGTTTAEAAVVLQALVVPCYVGVLLLAPQLTLLGEQWAGGVPALRWLAAYGLVLSALELAMVTLKATGHTRDTLVLTGLHLALLVALLLALIGRGVTFAAVAQCLAGAATLAVAGVVVHRRLRGGGALPWRHLLLGLAPVAVGTATMVTAVLAVEGLLLWGEVSVAALLTLSLVGAIAYVVPVLLLDRDDRTGLGAMVAKAQRVAERAVRLGRPGAGSLVLALLVVVVALAGTASVAAPVPTLVVAAAVVVGGAMVLRPDLALLAYVAVEPFGDLVESIHPAGVKAVGALLFGAWALRRAADRRPPRAGAAPRRGGVLAAGVLALVVVASLVAAGTPGDGVGTAVRYLSYIAVLVVVVDLVVDAGPARATLLRRLVAVYVASCTTAAVVGLATFLAVGGRASGPLSDPNDFAFYLVTAWPLALWLARTAPTSRLRALSALAPVLLVVGACATFSRGALMALAAMVVVALALGLLRARTLVAGAVVAGAALGAVWLAEPELVTRSLAEKDHVAASNVASRFTTWSMAAHMGAERPLLGQGPGGFAREAGRFVPDGAVNVTETVAHQMYLDVFAELGALGIGAFAVVIAAGGAGALRARRRRGGVSGAPADPTGLAPAVLVGLTGALVGACFLSEQYYLPVWLLAALGIALDPAPVSTPDPHLLSDPNRVNGPVS